MAIQILTPDQAIAFDAAVASGERPDFLQSWGWGELKATTGWLPHRLRLCDATGAAVGVCSVLERRLPGLGPLLYAPRGPLIDWGRAASARSALLDLASFARSRGAFALKCDPAVPVTMSECADALDAVGFRRTEAGASFEGVQPAFVMHLPLAGRTEADLLSHMAPKTRYNIRLAARKGVRVRLGQETDLPTFYDLLVETARRDGFGVRDFSYFQAMWRCLLRRGDGYLLIAIAEGEPLAGAIIFHMGSTAWYLYGASSNRKRGMMAPYAVQWEAISRALADGRRLYDFRGVSGDLTPTSPLYGLYRFKHGFGAELVEYVGEWDLPLRPAAYWMARRGVPAARHIMTSLRRRRVAMPAAEGSDSG